MEGRVLELGRKQGRKELGEAAGGTKLRPRLPQAPRFVTERRGDLLEARLAIPRFGSTLAFRGSVRCVVSFGWLIPPVCGDRCPPAHSARRRCALAPRNWTGCGWPLCRGEGPCKSPERIYGY